MEPTQFEVEIVHRRRLRYRVEAPDRETAERLALALWQDGDDGLEEADRCDMESVTVAPAPDAVRCGEDCEAALRFLRDRELVIEALDPDLFNPTVHDAVSAEEVAIHLKWEVTDGTGKAVADTDRAARALERLCREHRVVCFTRPRVREGERGEIRLFCTPQHLERLAAVLVPPDPRDEPAAATRPAAP